MGLKLPKRTARAFRGGYVQKKRRNRRGAATIDYFLLMAVVLPLATFMMQIAPRIMRSVYDLLTIVVSWPFL
jgi:hypothetical protein